MRYFNQVSNGRMAIYGFQHGTSNYKGWLNSIFEPYGLYPYINLLRPEIREVIYKKSLFNKFVPIFSSKLKLTSLINNLIGIDLLKNKDQGLGLIEELANVILQEVESRKSLEKRIADVEKTINAKKLFFRGLTQSIEGNKDEPTLQQRTSAAEGALVGIEAILNHVDAVASFNPALAQSLRGSGISWILSDAPYFNMVPGNSEYDGNIVAVRVTSELHRLIEKSIPFDRSIGWYPYARVVGVFHEALSSQFTNVKVVDWLWMSFRSPKSFDNVVGTLDAVLHNPKDKDNAYLPYVAEPQDLLLFLAGIHAVFQGQRVGFNLAREDVKELAREAMQAFNSSLPPELEQYFGLVPADQSRQVGSSSDRAGEMG